MGFEVTDFEIADVAEKERFEARDDDGTLAGVLTYQATGPIVVYTHTRAEAGFEGKGVEDVLVRAAMDDAKAKSRTVVPMCPLLGVWLDKHHEYDKFVARSTKKIK